MDLKKLRKMSNSKRPGILIDFRKNDYYYYKLGRHYDKQNKFIEQLYLVLPNYIHAYLLTGEMEVWEVDDKAKCKLIENLQERENLAK